MRASRSRSPSSRAAAGSAVDFYRPEREVAVLRGVVARNKGPLTDEEMVRLFREIMSACLAQEEPLKVGYLGPEGTFSQSAVYKHFGHSVRALPLGMIDEVFHEVESGAADFGVVPIENSTEGTVNHTLDMFLTSPLKICGEVEMRIRQHLLGNMTGLDKVAAGQCPSPVAGAVSRLAPGVPAAGGVACRPAAMPRARAVPATRTAPRRLPAMRLPRSMVSPRSWPISRIVRTTPPASWSLAASCSSASGNDKTSLLLSTKDTDDAGALQKLLAPLAEHQVNMSRIESRPSRRRKWHYVFFVDIDGHADDRKVAPALAKLRKRAQLFRVLGSYPKAVL